MTSDSFIAVDVERGEYIGVPGNEPSKSNHDVQVELVPPRDRTNNPRSSRRPRLLHPRAGQALVVSLVILGAMSIFLTSYSQRHNGLFTITSDPHDRTREVVLRFMWSSGPTSLMTALTGIILVPMQMQIYLVAPYIDLMKDGGATVEESLMANYASVGIRTRVPLIVRNKKWGLFCLVISGILALGLDIAASGLIESRNVNISIPVKVQVTAQLGLEQSADATNGTSDDSGNYLFLDTDQYYAAALFAGGQQLYRPSPPPFSFWNSENNWSIRPFALSSEGKKNLISDSTTSSVATVTAETYGVSTSANCKMAESITFDADNFTTATLGKCSYTFPVQGLQQPTDITKPYDRWHEANTTKCQDSTQSDFAFNAFVYQVYRPTGYTAKDSKQFVVVLCRPTITMSKVSATLTVSHDGDIGSMIEPPRLIATDRDDPNIAPLLSPPLNGMAVNGYNIAQTKGLVNGAPGSSRITRANGTQEILVEGIYAALHHYMGQDNVSSPSTDWFTDANRTKIGGIVSDFYQAYLNGFAPDIYYNASAPATTEDVSITFPEARAQVSPLHGVGLATLLFLLAVFMAATLRLQVIPDPQSSVWDFYPATILKHISKSDLSLFQHLSPFANQEDKFILDELGDQRYALQSGLLLLNPVDKQAALHAPAETPVHTPDAPADTSSPSVA